LSNEHDTTRSGRPPVIPVTSGAYKALKGGEAPAAQRRPERRPEPRRQQQKQPSAPRPARTVDQRTSGIKKILVAWLAFGAILYFGASGTFASFSAETSNAGSAIASGTLTMSNKVGTQSACLSSNAASANNANAVCDKFDTLANLAPGVYGGAAALTIQNTGSIDASKLYFWASPVTARLTTGLTNGQTGITSLTVSNLEGSIATGDHLLVTYGTASQTFIANGATAGGATSIAVNSATATAAFPAGAVVTDTDSNSVSSGNLNCYDTKTTTPGTVGATSGNDLNFNPVTGNPLCARALIYVQETTGGTNYCWLGKTYASGAPGMCVAPNSDTLSSGLSTGGAITALPVAALNGNVKSGESIVVTSGSNTQTFTASANAYIGATSISVNSATPNFAYPITSTVTDSSSLASLNSDTTDTIANFDTGHSSTGSIQLYPVTSNGAIDTAATVELTHNTNRTFQVGVYVPAPAGQNQNFLQGLQSTFGITWHIDQ
jgi:hypothetical protein